MSDTWKPKSAVEVDTWRPSSAKLVEKSAEPLSTEEESIGRKLYREIVSPVVSGSSTLAFGIPKAVAERTGTKELIYPEQKTLPGKALRFGAETFGFLAGGALKAGKAVAGKIGGDLLRNKVARSATEFGIAGALQTPEKDLIAPKERVIQGTIGAFLGAATPIAEVGIKNVVETTKQGFRVLKGLKLPTRQTLLKEKLNAEELGRIELNRLSEQGSKAKIALQQKLISEGKTLEAKATPLQEKLNHQQLLKDEALVRLNKIKDNAKIVFEDNKKILESKLKSGAEEDVLKYQKSLPEFYSSVSDTYGAMQDEAANNLALTRGNLTLDEVGNILWKTVDESDKNRLNYGRAYSKIKSLIDKGGKYDISIENPNMGKTFDVREVKADLDQIFRGIKYGKRGTSEEIPAHILRKHWGEFTAKEVPGYKDMQEFYSDVVDAIKLSDKYFQPGKGKLYTEQGVKYLMSVAEEEPSQARLRLFSALEKGNAKVKGVGNISKRVMDLGEEIRSLEAEVVSKEANISGRIDKLDIESKRFRYELAQELKKVKSASDVVQQGITNRIDKLGITSDSLKRKVTDEMKKRVYELETKMADRAKAMALATKLGIGIGIATGAAPIARFGAGIFGFRDREG